MNLEVLIKKVKRKVKSILGKNDLDQRGSVEYESSFLSSENKEVIDNYLEGETKILPSGINYENFTELCVIMKEHGSDKGHYVGIGKHNYTAVYYVLYERFRNSKVRLFELGIGTTNSNISANMGQDGKPGASLRGWREYFTEGLIFAADIDLEILFGDNRIQTFYCDQTNPKIIHDMWSNSLLKENFDIIIDDGLHKFDANVCFLENSIQKLKIDGIYVIEDVLNSQISLWENYIFNSSKKYPDLRFTILQIPNNFNRYDNNLIIIQKIKF